MRKRLGFVGQSAAAQTVAHALDSALCELMIHAPGKARAMALANSEALIGICGLEHFKARYGIEEEGEVLRLSEVARG